SLQWQGMPADSLEGRAMSRILLLLSAVLLVAPSVHGRPEPADPLRMPDYGKGTPPRNPLDGARAGRSLQRSGHTGRRHQALMAHGHFFFGVRRAKSWTAASFDTVAVSLVAVRSL